MGFAELAQHDVVALRALRGHAVRRHDHLEVAHPRLGVAALNPHSGEGGLFGDEEIRIIRPTVEKLREAGVACVGPISSDVIFLKALRGEYDGVVTMYHDQGQIATKLLGFNQGVTVAAGLKTVFTTPAHGTAFDIVGQGKADPGALEHAFTLAAKLAAGRKAASQAASSARE